MGSVRPGKTALLLEAGRIIASGPTHEVIEAYTNTSKRALRVTFPPRADGPSITGISLDEGALRRGDFFAYIEF